jgi:hypothetical protein
MRDYVDLERDGWIYNIMEANTESIQNISINNDTVIIKANPRSAIYSLAAFRQNTYIRLDTAYSY